MNVKTTIVAPTIHPSRSRHNMRRAIIWLLGMMIVLGSRSFADELKFPEQVVQVDYLKVAGTLHDGSPFEVAAKKRRFSGNNDQLSGSTFLSGDGESPRFVLERFDIAIGGSPIIIPNKAWIDISDPDLPWGIRLNQGARTLVVHVIGGDGAGSYRVSLLIQDGKLSARKVEQHGRPARVEKF